MWHARQAHQREPSYLAEECARFPRGWSRAAIFEVSVEDGRIILTPVQDGEADAARDKLADIGISDADVADAVTWARRR